MRYSLIFFLLSFCITSSYTQSQDSVYFATGFKVGQVTDSSAVIWTRLSEKPLPVPVYHKQGNTNFGAPINFDNEMPVGEMDGAVEGILGQVKISLISEKDTISTSWEYVSAYRDFTIKKKITGLSSNKMYQVIIEGRKRPNTSITKIEGKFISAPKSDEVATVHFTVSTCQYFWSYDDSIRGFKTYDSMKGLSPAFHCQTGDYVYYDKVGPKATNLELVRHKWHAMNSRPSLKEFFQNTSVYLQKDDHDLLKDDGTPFSLPYGEVSYQDGLTVWQEQVPIVDKPYGTFRWGQDLQIWVVEGREYRTQPNRSEDGEEKSMWGEEQKSWFKKTVKASDATFKILISPTPIVGPDRDKGKFDNQSNASYATEGNWLREYLVENDMIVINGDRHWQYVSVDDETKLWEFSSGAISNLLAGGWDKDDIRPEHRFLRVKGGFLSTKVYRENDIPLIEFVHYDVEGNEVNKERIKPNKNKRIYKR